MKEFAKHIVFCNGAKVEGANGNVKPLVLDYHEGCNNKNVTINLNKFTNEVYYLEDRLKDLLEIAGYIFAADRKTYRGANRDVEYHSWSREFHFHIKVRDYKFWQREDVKNLLNEVLVFATGDHQYNFTFYRGAEDFPASIFDNEKVTIGKPEDLKVVLFSGGLDSLAGTIELLETTNSELCLISHQSGQKGVIRTHNVIFNAVINEYKDRCKHYKYHCGFDHCKSTDETQRTRSFLYTATAFTIAKTYNQNCIYVYENGIISLNFAETQDLMNGRASRTTHPKTLGLLETLYSKIGETEFSIKNPFLFKTKTEVVDIIKNYNKLNLIEKSVSCSSTRNHPAKVPHCGKCSQCIDRRFAIYADEVETSEKGDFYAFDFLTEDLEKEDIKKSLTEYIKLAQIFSANNLKNYFIERGPELIEIEEFLDGKDEEERIGKVFDLCKRHAAQIEAAIHRMRKKYDSPYSRLRPKAFFSSIVGTRIYQKISLKNSEESSEETIEVETGKKEIEHNGLRSFKRGELKKELKKYITELKLEKYDTVPSKKINWITRQLRKKGFDAKETSVAAVLRKMDYSFSHEA